MVQTIWNKDRLSIISEAINEAGHRNTGIKREKRKDTVQFSQHELKVKKYL